MVINRKNEKKPIWTGIVIAVIINVMFYAIEWSLWKYTDLCNGVTWHYYDFAIRMSMGFLGIWALRSLTGGELKTVFCGKITPRAWLWCIPLGLRFVGAQHHDAGNADFSDLYAHKQFVACYWDSYNLGHCMQDSDILYC